MKFYAKWRGGPLLLLAATLACALVAVVSLRAALSMAVGPRAFALVVLVLLSLPASVVLGLYTASFWMLSYRMDRNGLLIWAGLLRLYVPMAAIEGIYGAPRQYNPFRVRGLRFAGHNVAAQTTPQGGPIIYLATTRPEDCLYVTTAKRTYAISPSNPEQFLKAYALERELGPVQAWRESVRAAAVLQTLVWRDRLGLALVSAALLACLALLALTFWRYPDLPAQIPLHFDALGRPDRLGPPRDLFYLPLIGSVVVFANFALAIAFYNRERLLSYCLWGGAGLVQVLLIFALRSIVA